MVNLCLRICDQPLRGPDKSVIIKYLSVGVDEGGNERSETTGTNPVKRFGQDQQRGSCSTFSKIVFLLRVKLDPDNRKNFELEKLLLNAADVQQCS